MTGHVGSEGRIHVGPVNLGMVGRSAFESLLKGGGPGVGNGLPQETAFCRKRPAVGNSLYQETAETILRHLFRKS